MVWIATKNAEARQGRLVRHVILSRFVTGSHEPAALGIVS